MIEYLPILIYIVIVLGLAALILTLTTILGPKKTNALKELPFETGNLPTKGSAREGFPFQYYVVAILFVVFDIEIAFLYPWAVKFKSLGMFGFIEMMVFLTILLAGWYYIIKRGILEWK